MLSPMPSRKTKTKMKLNQGMNPAKSAAEQAMAGPAVSAARVPKRSSTTPLTGIPTNRPTAKAVIVCAAVPGLMSKDFASTGSAGTIIDHIPASSVLV